MLDFFKKTAKVYLNVFFWLFMIADVVAGIALGQSVHIVLGIFGTIILWLATVFIFSIVGSFIALVDDVSAIRRKVDGGALSQEQSVPTARVQTGNTNTNENISRFWDCPKCGHSNTSFNTFCDNCGTRKP